MSGRPGSRTRRGQMAGVAATAVAAALAAMCVASPAGAQDAGAKRALRLAAGEHGAFSRIVVQGGPRGGWSLLSGQRRFDLRLPGEAYAIDHDAVTRHRRAHRITAMRSRREAGETVLSFALNCDCAAKATPGPEGLLIVDVHPRVKTTESRQAMEDSGAIETASVKQETAPLDVEGARDFLMLQLKRAAKQGLIRYKRDRKADAATEENTQRPAATDAPAEAAADRLPRDGGAQDAARDSGAEAAPERFETSDHGRPGPERVDHAAGEKAAAARTVDATQPLREKAAEEPAAKADTAEESPAQAKSEPQPASKSGYDKQSLKDFFSAQRSGAPAPAPAPKPGELRHDAPPVAKREASKPAHGPTEENAAAHGEAPHGAAPARPDSQASSITAKDKAETAPSKTAAAEQKPAKQAAKDAHGGAEKKVAKHGHGAASPAPEAQAEVVAPPPPCPDEEPLDPRHWPYAEPYNGALAERRSMLFDGLNRVEPEAVAQLQMLYLAHGFGPEAAAAPASFKVDDETVVLLGALGDAVAGRPPAKGSAFNRAQACPGRQAFWQAIALAKTEPKRAVQAYKLSQRALWRMPTTLRRLYGERIALAATRAGDLDTAAGLLALLERSQKEPTPALRVVRAELALVEGRTVAAQSELDKVARSRDENNLEAALQLAESFVKPFEAARALEIADLLADFAMQRRGGPDMVRAITAEAKLRARFGRLPEAITAVEISQRYGGYGAEQLEALRVAILDGAVAALAPSEAKTEFDAQSSRKTGHDADAGYKPKRSYLRRSAKRDKEALALAAQLVEQVSALPPSPQNDRIRIELAEQVTVIGAPHLARLLIDDAFAARSAEADAARREADEAAALVDPLGALTETGDARRPGAGRSAVAPLLSELEAADAKGLDQMTAPQEQERVQTDPSLEKLRAGKNMTEQPAGTIEAAESLLNDLKDDLTLLRELAARQKAAAAPDTAPAAGAGASPSASKGETDG